MASTCEDYPAQLISDDFFCHSAEAATRIFQPLWHSEIAEHATWSYEACLRLIFFFHPYLVIAGVAIKQAHHFGFCCGVDQRVDSWAWILVLRTDLV